MRWRLIRRRLSISAPRMAIRSHMPWPLRWAVAALMLGFSAALALWAFEFGRNIAGLSSGGQVGRKATEELAQLRQQLDDARHDRDAAQSVANSADSMLKAERVTQQRLAEQVKSLEAENLALKDDLGFFERLLPASGSGLSVRGVQTESPAPGQLRFQALIMQQGGRNQPEFKGRVEVLLSGLRDGRPWADTTPAFTQALLFKQYRRIEGQLSLPPRSVVKQVQIRVLDEAGQVRAGQVQAL
jgi:exonuclease VII small subunit